MAHAEPNTITVRATARQCDLIDQAAARLGCSRAAFMLDASCMAAVDLLLVQAYIGLDEDQLAGLLGAQLPMSPRLMRTLNALAAWEPRGKCK